MAKTDYLLAPIRPAAGANGLLRHEVDGTTIEVDIEADPGIGTLQWFHFAVDAADGTRIRIVNAGASTYPHGWSGSVAWTRSPSDEWRPLETLWQDGVVEFTHHGKVGVSFYALFPPYPIHRLELLLQRARARPDAEIVLPDAGTGQAPRISLGDRDPAARQIWIIAGQHGGEHPAIWFADGLADAMLVQAAPPAGMRFHIVPIANLQGMMAGHLRTNAAGQDPNRHWGNPSGCGEVETLVATMQSTGVDLLLDVHTDFELGCVYFDVLEEWMSTPGHLVRTRERFERSLADRSPDFAFGRRFPWQEPPCSDLLAGMCAPGVERRFGTAALTLELPIGRYRNAAGEEHIWTPNHSRSLGRSVASILLECDWCANAQ